ncbi:MAG: glycogen synthase [Chloroflexi bacterium]|nr:glycogen synthase [Chloroflexota bacterium]
MTVNVLFIAAESEPFIKIGGLGDVAGALPAAIHRIAEKQPAAYPIDIRVALPYYRAIKEKGFPVKFLGEFNVPKKETAIPCQVYLFADGEFPVYFLDGAPIAESAQVYSLNTSDDGDKFVFFSSAALRLADFLNWKIDILHANDWHTATAIYALKNSLISSPQLSRTKTVHSLHNLPFMGYGIQQSLSDYGLPPSQNPTLPEWARHVPLPLGLLHADKIIAVSPHYAKEILTPQFGCGLEDFLATRTQALTGIINGLDIDLWNPETNPHIQQNFTADSLSRRLVNKRHLQTKFQLPKNDRVPVMTLISRMDPQKGIDIALKGLEYCQDLDWQAVILGTGTPEVEAQARELETRFPDRVRAIIDFDNKLAHQLYAGADLFLMPSRYEPCGLSQMISMRYGCIPVARKTGGLADTIHSVSGSVNGGTGFLFVEPYPSAFAGAVKRAIRYYHKPELWEIIQRNGMKIDFSWESSAKKYIEIYLALAKTPRAADEA